MESVPKKKVSFTEYQGWTDDERWEIIDGHPYAMSAPTTFHQMISMDLSIILGSFFRGKPCRVLASPLDVRLSEYDVVQPDLVVVCDKAQIVRTHIEGAPTLAIEILSPSTLRHDRIRKARLYAASGVKEYWIVHPSPAMVEIYLLDGESFRLHAGYTDADTLQSPTFPELSIVLSEIFPFEEVDEVKEGRPPEYATGTVKR